MQAEQQVVAEFKNVCVATVEWLNAVWFAALYVQYGGVLHNGPSLNFKAEMTHFSCISVRVCVCSSCGCDSCVFVF